MSSSEITPTKIASGIFGILSLGSSGYAAFNNRYYAYTILACIVLIFSLYINLIYLEDDLGGAIGSSISLLMLAFILGIIMTGSWFITIPLLLSRKSTSEKQI